MIDTELVERAMNGDGNSFAGLYQDTYTQMKYYALKLVKNESDAEDIVQEAYLKAWKNRESLKDYSKFESWLTRIVSNTAINFLVKNKPSLFTDISDDSVSDYSFEESIEDVSTATRPDMAYSKKELSEMVEMLLDCLSDEQRICVVMRFQNDMPIKEIAEQLGVNENTVKSRLRYANKNMNVKAEEMKKKGYRFYGLAPLPLLAILLKSEMKVYAASSAVAATASATTSAATASVAAGTTAKAGFFSTVAGKITAVAVIAAIVGTAATAVAVSNNKNKPVTTQPAAVSQTAQAQTTEKKEEKVDLDKVITAYENYVSKDYPDSGYDYEFIFVDDNDVPELYVDGEITAASRFLLTYDNGKVKEISGGILSYKERSGIFEITPNHFQTQENYTIYELTNGKAKELHNGQVNYNNSGDESDYTYIWDGKTVTGDEFNKLHKEAFDRETATANERYDTFGEAVKALEKKTGYKTDSKTDDALYINELKNFVNGHNQKMKEMYSSENKNRGVIDKFSFYDVDCDGTPELFAYMTFPDGEGNYWRIWKENGEIKTLQSVGEFGILKEKYCMIVYGDMWEEFYCFNPADKHEASCELADGTGVWNGNPCSRETYLKKRNALADVNKKVKLKYYNSIDEAYKHYKNH